MKKALLIGFVALGLLFYLLPSNAKAESGRIYGTIRTIDHEDFEGWIRWDKNEAYWDDIIDATKERKSKRYKRKSRRRSSSNFFIWGSGSSRQSELKFGHIKTLLPVSSSEAVITLKSGEEYEMSGSDLGTSVRDIIVDDKEEGEIWLDWDDIDEINFSKEPTAPESSAERLYGKLTTRRGEEFVGWIEWDRDEVMTTDILDGDEGRRKNRKIKFGKIKSLERRSSSSCIVTLKSGKEMKLSGTNDVNSESRGIRVKDPALGRIDVEWNDLDIVEFMPVPLDQLPRYDSFDGGRKIRGTVFTEDGEQFEGEIIWDNDEQYTWEHLNGNFQDLDIVVEFANIKLIERHSRRGAVITTKAGRNILLKGSNDVNSENNGIIVKLDDGDEVEIDWYDFEKAEFK
jgi:hypothetical protein